MYEWQAGPIEVRTWLELLDRAECDRLLETQHVGRLAIVINGQPLIFPVNYAMLDGAVVFRTARGTKLFGAAGHSVAFEIDGTDPITTRGGACSSSAKPRNAALRPMRSGCSRGAMHPRITSFVSVRTPSLAGAYLRTPEGTHHDPQCSRTRV